MSLKVGIVGAGIVGRLIAFELIRHQAKVTIFDSGPPSGAGSCSYYAAGMLAPFCEWADTSEVIHELGVVSLELWPTILHELNFPVFFQRSGTLVIALPSDQVEVQRFRERIFAKTKGNGMQVLASNQVRELEPELDGYFSEALYFPLEGQLDPRQVLSALWEKLRQSNVEFCFETEIEPFTAVENFPDIQNRRFDWVIDCRGYGAAKNLPKLRAVRGELIWLRSPEVRLQRPIRVLHPRHHIYIAPRPDGLFVLGATTIESDDTSPISVRSTLEMLSMANILLPAFSEARIVETVVGLRPAFPTNHPCIIQNKTLLHVNGLYRHGFLLGPKIAQLAVARMLAKKTDFESIFTEVA